VLHFWQMLWGLSNSQGGKPHRLIDMTTRIKISVAIIVAVVLGEGLVWVISRIFF
jgi:hypothetical protein